MSSKNKKLDLDKKLGFVLRCTQNETIFFSSMPKIEFEFLGQARLTSTPRQCPATHTHTHTHTHTYLPLDLSKYFCTRKASTFAVESGSPVLLAKSKYFCTRVSKASTFALESGSPVLVVNILPLHLSSETCRVVVCGHIYRLNSTSLTHRLTSTSIVV